MNPRSYYAECGDLMGHDFEQVREWLAAHSAYVGNVILDLCDGSDQRIVGQSEFFDDFDLDALQVAVSVSGRKADAAIELRRAS